MTLAASAVKLQYAGDNSTISFPITFVYWLDEDIEVILTDALGVETLWTNGTEYTSLF